MEPVKQHLIQFSPIQGEYWFYDLDHPRVIAFCRNGRWEAEYVTQVQYTATDPRIKDVAVGAVRQQALDAGHPSPPAYSSTTVPPDSRLDAVPLLPSLHSALHPSTPSQIHPKSPLSPTSPSSQGSGYDSPILEPQLPAIRSYPSHQRLTGASDSRTPYTSTKNSTWREWASGEWQRKPGHGTDAAVPVTQQPRQMKILLSLDGDGVRGLSTATIVDVLVSAVSKRVGRRLEPYQIFDMIGGTSTGGLLAIMLGRLRMHSDAAIDSYLRFSKTLITQKSNFFRHKHHLIRAGISAGLTEPLPDTQPLETELKSLVKTQLLNEEEGFWDTRTDSPNIFVISTLISNDRMRPAVIRSYPTRRITNPVIRSTLKTWEAMCATCAGLPYTNPEDPNADAAGLLVDGSIKKSNPIKDMFFECRSLYHINDPMMIVSIGTGAAPPVDDPHAIGPRSELRELAENVSTSERHSKSASLKFEYDERDIMDSEWLKYFRFNDPGMRDCGLEEWNEKEHVERSTRDYLEGRLDDTGERFNACVEAIARVLTGEKVPEPGSPPAPGPSPYTPLLGDYADPFNRLKRRRLG